MGTEEGQTPLSDLLSDEQTEAPAAEQPAPEPQQTEDASGQLRDEQGRFAKEGEQEEGASPAPVEEPPFDHAAVKGERTRRQAAEQERDTFRAELEALKQQFQQFQQPKEPPAPPPSVWEDEQGWQQHLQQQIIQQADQLSRINASEMAARSQHSDFQEMYDLFNTMASQNPAVVQQAMADPHPWGKAYEIAKNHKTMTELGAVDLADLEAKMREKIMAEMQQVQTPVPQATVPPSLTGERNVGTRSGPAWGGPKSLDQLLG